MFYVISLSLIGLIGVWGVYAGASGRCLPLDVYRNGIARCIMIIVGLLLVAGTVDQIGRL